MPPPPIARSFTKAKRVSGWHAESAPPSNNAGQSFTALDGTPVAREGTRADDERRCDVDDPRRVWSRERVCCIAPRSPPARVSAPRLRDPRHRLAASDSPSTRSSEVREEASVRVASGKGRGGGGDGRRDGDGDDGAMRMQEWGWAACAGLSAAFLVPGTARASGSIAGAEPQGSDMMTCFLYGFSWFYGVKLFLKASLLPVRAIPGDHVAPDARLRRAAGTARAEAYEAYVKPWIPVDGCEVGG